jgi:hypothetical protein
VVYFIEVIAMWKLLPGMWLKPLFVISLPFAGKIAFSWYIVLLKTLGMIRFLKLKWFNKQTYKNLLEMKSAILKKLDKVVAIKV